MGTEWTDEKLEAAAQMKRDGKSYGQIAVYFGVSRSAMIGVGNRNRHLFAKSKRAVGGRTVGARAKTAAAAPKTAKLAAKPTGKVRAKSGKGSARLSALGVTVRKEGVVGTRRDLSVHKLPGVATVRFADLASAQCAFPLTTFDEQDGPDMPCCGAPAEKGKRWCAAHCEVVFIERAR